MNARTIQQIVTVEPQPGTGILHPFPTAELRHLDPFVFLDTGAPLQLDDRDIYVGPHPHRGVQPVSLLFRGRIEHRDSLGTHRQVDSGGMQWLVAGRGALHEEVLNGDAAGVFHMAQLWINVPAALKMADPEHHTVPPDGVPVLELDGARLRLYAGEFGGVHGPAPMPTPVLVAHVALAAGSQVEVPIARGWTAAVTVVDGHIDGAQEHLPPGATVVFADDGDSMSVSSTAGGEVLLMAGHPIGEPIAMGGGFVMTTGDEITEAFADHDAGLMGVLAASR